MDQRFKKIILKTAVEARGEVQDFELESLLRGGDIPQVVKAPPRGSNSNSKDCAYPPHSTAVFRLITLAILFPNL